jgi:hypothetical protein
MRIVFSYSAWVVVAMVVFVFAMAILEIHGRLAVTPMEDHLMWILVISVGVLLMLANVILFIGMTMFCVLRKRASESGTVSWLVLFFFSGPLGSAVYYFAVYRRLASTQTEATNA